MNVLWLLGPFEGTSEWFFILGEGTVTENVIGNIPAHASGPRVHFHGTQPRVEMLAGGSARSLLYQFCQITFQSTCTSYTPTVAPHSCQYLKYQSFKF